MNEKCQKCSFGTIAGCSNSNVMDMSTIFDMYNGNCPYYQNNDDMEDCFDIDSLDVDD